MSVHFDVTAANAFLSFTVGGAGAIGTGARTIAALVQLKSGNNNGGFLGAYQSGSVIVEEFAANNGGPKLFGQNDFSNGWGPSSDGSAAMSLDTWYVVGMTHPGTSAPWRMHIWPYAADGSGTMFHGVSTGAGNHTQTSTAADELRVGGVDVKGNGDVAVAGWWTRACSDADMDGLKTNLLTAWLGLSNGGPTECQHFRDWNGTTGAVIAAGTSTFSSQTGSTTAGANPPSFDFSISAAMGQLVGLTQPF